MEKKIIIAARILSFMFNPLYLSLVGMILMFWFSYLSLLPTLYKLTILLLVYFFTIFLPSLVLRLYRKCQGWKHSEIGRKLRRMMPYILPMMCYLACYAILNFFHVPYFICIILIIALEVQLVCAFVNVWWKISSHSAAIGAVTGSIIGFSLLFCFYLLWWLSLVLIASGMVCSARLVLRQHTLPQVLVGYALGLAVSILKIIYL